MKRAIALLLAALLSLTPSTALAHPRLVDRINTFRVNHGRHALHYSRYLHKIAIRRSHAIYSLFDHDLSWMYQTHCRMVGENIAYRIPAPEHPNRWAFRAWRESDPHRTVMLMREWDKMAAHIYLAPNGGAYAVAVFCDRG